MLLQYDWITFADDLTLGWCHLGLEASLIINNSAVCWTACSDQLLRNTKTSHYWRFVSGIQRRPVDSPHTGPVIEKVFLCHNVFMISVYCNGVLNVKASWLSLLNNRSLDWVVESVSCGSRRAQHWGSLYFHCWRGLSTFQSTRPRSYRGNLLLYLCIM